MNHWVIQAYRRKIPGQSGLKDDYGLADFVEVSMDAEIEEEAITKAKEMIKRKYYRVAKVWECNENYETDQEMKILQLKIQAEMLKRLK